MKQVHTCTAKHSARDPKDAALLRSMQASQVVNAVGPRLCHQQAQDLQDKKQPQSRMRVKV
jgi:hypothetical protein